MSFENPGGGVKFTPIDTVPYVIALGALGYIDTDCSAALGLHIDRLYVIVTKGNGGADVGSRKHGETKDSKAAANNSNTLFAFSDSAGHIDFYRAGVENTYYVIGYFS